MSPQSRDLDRFDSVYVSPRAEDALLSCAGRIVSELQRGERVLLVSLLAGGGAAPLSPPGSGDAASVSRHDLALAPAAERDGGEGTSVSDVAESLREIGHSTRARHVYVPLGLGAHPDQRLCHDAALLAFRSGAERNVFLYEERPEALVPGAVRMRLAHLGAWLPPGAADAADDAGLARFLLRASVPAAARGASYGWADRLRSTGAATKAWREARAWSPVRGLGPRLQPVVHVADADALPRVRDLVAASSPPASVAPKLARRLAALAEAYGRGLGAEGHVERYWLLLPVRDRDEQATVPPPSSEDALAV